jgi:hypothetical protein
VLTAPGVSRAPGLSPELTCVEDANGVRLLKRCR